MALLQKKRRLNNIVLKGLALFFGYYVWIIFSAHHKIEIVYNVPLFFYNTEKKVSITAPESIPVTLYGTRTELFKIIEKGSIHTDASILQEGEQLIDLKEQNIFLPANLQLVHCNLQKIKIIKKTNQGVL